MLARQLALSLQVSKPRVNRVEKSKFSMTSVHVASFICHLCTYNKFSMTSFWFSERLDSYY
jgi:hypothetical protein